MPGRGPQTFKKRQKEQQRKERQEEKMAKRLARKEQGPESPIEGQDELEPSASPALGADDDHPKAGGYAA